MVINHLIYLRNLKEKIIRRKSVKENHSKKVIDQNLGKQTKVKIQPK